MGQVTYEPAYEQGNLFTELVPPSDWGSSVEGVRVGLGSGVSTVVAVGSAGAIAAGVVAVGVSVLVGAGVSVGLVVSAGMEVAAGSSVAVATGGAASGVVSAGVAEETTGNCQQD